MTESVMMLEYLSSCSNGGKKLDKLEGKERNDTLTQLEFADRSSGVLSLLCS